MQTQNSFGKKKLKHTETRDSIILQRFLNKYFGIPYTTCTRYRMESKKPLKMSVSLSSTQQSLTLSEIYANNSTPMTGGLELLTHPLSCVGSFQNLGGWVGQRLLKCHESLHQPHAAGRGVTEHLITSLNLLSQMKAITQNLRRTDS